uniref:Uncharacterized protein n=1 Tax=Micrurus surinamensis TaxID=129470 RepID=A0A2D4P4G7_MICSU
MRANPHASEGISRSGNVFVQNNGPQQTRSAFPSVAPVPSGPVLVEIENLPRNSGTSQQDKKWPHDARDCSQRGGNAWNMWSTPSAHTVDRHCNDFVRERNVKNAGMYRQAYGSGFQTTVTDL